MTLSEKAKNILEVWEKSESNIVVSSVAGSGKTTLLMEALKTCRYKTLFLAFNKAIQEEISEKISDQGLNQGKAMTLHALGLSAIRGSGKRVRIHKNKNWDLVKKTQEVHKREFKSINFKEKLAITYSLMDLNDISRMYLTEDFEEMKVIMATMDKSVPLVDNMDKFWKTFCEIREASYEEKVLEIDFVDMIYLPVIKKYYIPVDPYYLLIDECQDLSLMQHRLIDLLIGQGAVQQWMAVGDRNQAIYSFAGATSHSFDLFFEKPGEVVDMPLDICYRCPVDIVAQANQVYNVMIPNKSYEGIVGTVYDIEDIKPNSLIICRNSSPLIAVYFKLLAAGRPSFIYGEDIMQYLIRFLKSYMNKTVAAAKRDMNRKYLQLLSDTSEQGKFQTYIFEENYTNFINIESHLCEDTDTVNVLVDRLKELFEDRTDAIKLCTIHKSKGLEADIVYILNENLIPSRFAKSDEQLRQEKNLKYVARTRAKEELYYLNIDVKRDDVINI